MDRDTGCSNSQRVNETGRTPSDGHKRQSSDRS